MTRLLCAAATAACLLLVAAPPAAADDGAGIFATYCSACHGTTGAGDGAAAVALDPKPANLNDPEFWKTRDDAHIRKVISEGGASVGKSPLMAAWGAVLDSEQLDAVVKYVVSKKPGSESEKPETEKPETEKAETEKAETE